MNKAETLEFLRTRLKSALVLPQYSVTQGKFSSQGDIDREICEFFPGVERFVVRSSFSDEDGQTYSLAGKFTSFVDVTASDVVNSLDKVFASYSNNNSTEVAFVQPYLSETIRSGVVFSHIPSTGQPYVVDNFVLSANTSLITSGTGSGFKHTCLIQPKKGNRSLCKEDTCRRLRELVVECIDVLDCISVDIEYAVSKEGLLYVFQVRPLRTASREQLNLVKHLEQSRDFLTRNMRNHPFIAGNRTIYGVMPDWNPAEIIGRRPKRLALSLYRELITDSIWAYQRDNYGYKNLRSFPLLVEINHQPFIDTRVSFNSLIPKGLDNKLEDKLVNYYLDKLEQNRNFHDKIEFEIVLSSWTFDIQSKLNALPANFTENEKKNILHELKELTKKIILSEKLEEDISRVNNLTSRKNQIDAQSKNGIRDLFWLLEDCKRWGTLPFAGLARAAFIATQIIKSLELVTDTRNLLSDFISDLNTVTSQMQSDTIKLNREDFLLKYGHLRPGTYDITSKTYREAYDLYFKNKPDMTNKIDQGMDETRIKKLLENENFYEQVGVTPDSFLKFARKAIYWREQSKFEFTKNLSLILDLILQIGSELEFSRDDLAFLDIKDLTRAYSTSLDLKDEIFRSIELGKSHWAVASNIELPSLITCSDDLYFHTEQDALANFVTTKKISGKPNSDLKSLDDHIVLIESADPGFDWIFQHRILALITAWGGANSHMSIRCSELGIPAVIGVGERLFQELSSAHTIHLDCGNRIVEYR